MTTPFSAGHELTAADLDATLLIPGFVGASTLITSTSATNLITFPALLPGVTYGLSGALFLTNGATATNPAYNPGGSFTGNLTFGAWSFVNNAAAGSSVVGINSTLRFGVTTTSIPANTSVATMLSGFIAVTAAGSFTWGASQTTSGQSFTVLAGSYLTLQQLT